jgi:DNA-binding response OmpR family regulator
MCVSRLRRKLDSKDSQRSRIKTIRSVGYLFSMEE